MDEFPEWKGCGTTEEGSDFEIGGLCAWKHPWRSVGGPVYRIEAQGKAIEFKAQEVSMTVWSFWIRNQPG